MKELLLPLVVATISSSDASSISITSGKVYAPEHPWTKVRSLKRYVQRCYYTLHSYATALSSSMARTYVLIRRTNEKRRTPAQRQRCGGRWWSKYMHHTFMQQCFTTRKEARAIGTHSAYVDLCCCCTTTPAAAGSDLLTLLQLAGRSKHVLPTSRRKKLNLSYLNKCFCPPWLSIFLVKRSDLGDV